MRETDEPQRKIYVCLGCVASYLPPQSMTYPTPGLTASPAHCTNPHCATAVHEAVTLSGLPEEKLGELARRAAGLDGEPRRPRSGRRTARGRRAAASPSGGRDKLR